MTPELQTCPRRVESFRTYEPNTDTWSFRGSHRTCSYCGSLHPSDALARLIAGEKLGPTDKNYKAYVGEMEKLYFQHFIEAQMIEFIALYNDKKLNVGYPGHLYTLPFFMTYAEPTSI